MTKPNEVANFAILDRRNQVFREYLVQKAARLGIHVEYRGPALVGNAWEYALKRGRYGMVWLQPVSDIMIGEAPLEDQATWIVLQFCKQICRNGENVS